MDDDSLVLRVLVKWLEHLGHKVTAVSDGEAAIEAYKEALVDGDRYALCIFDLNVSSGMGGAEALEEIRKSDSSVRAIASSGGGAASDFIEVLSKPYSIEKFAATLAALLPRATRRGGQVKIT